MKRTGIFFLIFCFSFSVWSGEVKQWKKFPVIAVPMVNIPPMIDGVVDKKEWFSAAKISCLLDYYTGLKTEDRTFIYLAYDRENFYVAFQFERPQNALSPRADIVEKDKGLGQDDVFEMLLDVEHSHARCFDFGGNVKGVFWDGIGKPNVDKAWNGNWQYKARTTDWGWEGEIAISFKDFGIKTPELGTVWGADFVRNERTPVDRLAVWSFRGKNWHKFINFGHLIFSGEPLAICMDEIGWFGEQAGINLRISNFSDEETTIKYVFEIRKAQDKLSENFYPAVENALTEDLGFAILGNLDQEIENTLKLYPVVKSEDREITVSANHSCYLSFSVPNEPGDYILLYQIRTGEETLAAALTPFKVTLPLAISMESYPFSSGKIFYEIDLKRLKNKIKDTAVLEMKFLHGTKVIDIENFEGIKNKEKVTGEFNIQELVGTYLVEATLKEGKKVLAENQEPVIIPERPIWLKNEIGKKVAVPRPWVPVKAKNDSCEVWGRKFSWKTGSFLPEIEILGKNILAGPMELIIKDEKGEKINWKKSVFNLISDSVSKGDKAEYEFKIISDNITLQGEERIEFDGMVWIEMKIIPQKKQKISMVSLEIPVRKEFAKLYTCGEVLVGDRIAEKLTGLIPPEGINHRFAYASWIGNSEAGIQWFAESDKNWVLENQENAIQVIPENEKTLLRINFIQTNLQISESLDFSFGFIPTPTRPKPENWHNIHFYQFAGIFPRVTEEIRQKNPKNAWKWERLWKWIDEGGLEKDGVSVVIFFNWSEIFGYPGTFSEERKKLLKMWIDLCHKKNIKVLLYTGWGVSVEGPEWKEYGKEMVRIPLRNTGYSTYRQCPASLFTDWFVYKCWELIKDFDIDGVFLDSTASLVECNGPHGCGWQDKEGKLHSSFPILKTRELFKRLYTLFHEEGKKDGVIYSHQSPPAIMPIESFEDVRCGGELAQFYQGEFDAKYLAYFMAKLGGEQYGLFSEMTNKNWMDPPIKVNEVLSIAIPLNISVKSINAFAVQDYSLLGEPMPKIHNALRWIEAASALYLPWWKNDRVVMCNPEEKIISALWVKKGEKALLCLSNLSKESRNLEVEINLSQLGLKSVNIVDAINEGKIEQKEGKFTIEIEGRRYRLLKISGE
ncbi:MAG: DUF6067 family protein [Candidatus Omnitrophica bacterium]|nr:DUF6067 family protein [Candidatus Omnitrophota bacterium]